MLKIYTDSSMSNKKYLENIEAEFNIDELVIDNMYKDELSVYILKMIEGVTSRTGKYLDAKYGTVSIMDISTGCKALLLCVTRNKDCIINIDEIGNNAVKFLAELSKNIDIDIVTHRVLKYFPDEFRCYINDEYYEKDDIQYALAEILGEDDY